MLYFLWMLLEVLALIVPLLLAIAYLTLLERKLMAAYQRRKGPNVVGVYGLLQALADGVKLLLKESIFPSNADKLLFLVAPILSFSLSLMGWAVISYSQTAVFADLNLGILYLLAISSIAVYGLIIAGWSSNSKYAFLGCLRSSAQMISYEVSIGFILLTIVLCTNSFNITNIIEFQEEGYLFFPLFPIAILFFISMLAETNRHPFDLPEAEAELVSGYNVEYSAAGFVLFFLAEYGNILLMSSLSSILFFGGWLDFFSWLHLPGVFNFAIKIIFFAVFFITARALLPRLRYDQLMNLGWKYFLPISISLVLIVASLVTIEL
jgi:NADH-quinone oxidoreductase subunit H